MPSRSPVEWRNKQQMTKSAMAVGFIPEGCFTEHDVKVGDIKIGGWCIAANDAFMKWFRDSGAEDAYRSSCSHIEKKCIMRKAVLEHEKSGGRFIVNPVIDGQKNTSLWKLASNEEKQTFVMRALQAKARNLKEKTAREVSKVALETVERAPPSSSANLNLNGRAMASDDCSDADLVDYYNDMVKEAPQSSLEPCQSQVPVVADCDWLSTFYHGGADSVARDWEAARTTINNEPVSPKRQLNHPYHTILRAKRAKLANDCTGGSNNDQSVHSPLPSGQHDETTSPDGQHGHSNGDSSSTEKMSALQSPLSTTNNRQCATVSPDNTRTTAKRTVTFPQTRDYCFGPDACYNPGKNALGRITQQVARHLLLKNCKHATNKTQ